MEQAFGTYHRRGVEQGRKESEQKLAAAQAREAKLRDFIFDYIDIEPNNERMIQRYDECVKPTDDTALRQWGANLLREMAASIGNTSYNKVDAAWDIECELRRKADELENVSKNLDKNSNM